MNLFFLSRKHERAKTRKRKDINLELTRRTPPKRCGSARDARSGFRVFVMQSAPGGS
jgi:hypothetical protein